MQPTPEVPMALFDLPDDSKELFALAKDFAVRELWPRARHHDETAEFPLASLAKIHELGLLNAWVPESAGGLGLGTLSHALLGEALSYGNAGFSTAFIANDLAGIPVVLGGNQSIYEEFLAPMVSEPRMAAYCVTEPGAGSDVAAIRTTAKKTGDHYVLNGSKIWITNAGHASWFFVLAKTDPTAGHKGMSGFVVPADLPGVIVGKKEDNMGQRCSDTRAVTFQDVAVPAKWLLGREGDGFKLAMGAFDKTRPAVAGSAVGLAQRALDCALEYAATRAAFGKPIADHQGVSFLLADMARDIEASRLLTYKSAAMADEGVRNTYFASLAKLMAADSCMRITTDAVQIFGGYGYNREYPVEMLMRDAKIFQIYEGTSQIQRVVVARHLLDGRV
jgi:acyl-CoA dehydrogenase